MFAATGERQKVEESPAGSGEVEGIHLIFVTYKRTLLFILLVRKIIFNNTCIENIFRKSFCDI